MSVDNFQVEAKRIVDDQRRDREALVRDPRHFSHILPTLLIIQGRGE